jgi:hypothetical protein
MTDSRLFSRLSCRFGFHRWSKLGTSKWLNEPSPYRNELGIAMEYRTCQRRGCFAITDVSSFFSGRDEDHGVPTALGPIAAKRWEEVRQMPRRPLLDKPIPLEKTE